MWHVTRYLAEFREMEEDKANKDSMILMHLLRPLAAATKTLPCCGRKPHGLDFLSTTAHQKPFPFVARIR